MMECSIYIENVRFPFFYFQFLHQLHDKLLINTLIHARYEITYTNGLSVIENLIKENLIDLLSIMDHTPGQGQFKTEDQIKDYYGDRFGVGDASIRNLIETRMNIREKHGSLNAQKVVDIANKYNVPVASHDDDSAEKVESVKKSGVIISEFPVTMDAVKAAKKSGLYIALGSPNILRGYSHNNNLTAIPYNSGISVNIANTI